MLGSVTFQDTEIPDSMVFGGAQAYQMHKLVGGVRVADAMGRDDEPKTWSGTFLGPDASTRARQLDAIRIAGKPVSLTWDEFSFTVLVVAFRGEFKQSFYVPYSVTVEVIFDNAAPVTASATTTVDDQVGADMTTATGLSSDVADPTLSGYMTTLQTQVSAVPSFLSVTQDTINGVIATVNQAKARVTTLIGSAESVLNGLPGFAGVVAGAPAAQSAAGLLSAIQSFGQCTSLYGLQNILGRIGKNLASVQKAGTQVTTDGVSTLYDYAAQTYGDPSEWTTIAEANGLTDPQVAGGATLLIPAASDGDGGVLQQ